MDSLTFVSKLVPKFRQNNHVNRNEGRGEAGFNNKFTKVFVDQNLKSLKVSL